jgi:hypothetical protein
MTATHTALMPTEEWIAYMLDLYHAGWRTAPDSAELMLVDGPDERGPWMVQTTGVEAELLVDGVRCFSACWR